MSDQPVGAAVDPNQPFDGRGFGIAAGIVAVLAAALALGFGAAAGRARSWLRPAWAHPARPWNGFAIAFAFGAFQVAVAAVADGAHQLGWFAAADAPTEKTLNAIAARAIAVPLFFVFAAIGTVNASGPIRVPGRRRLAGWIALGAVAWFALAAATIGVHVATLAVQQEIGGPVDEHPLSKLHPARDGFGGWLFGAAVCAMTPWFEEFIFRGLLLPWAMRRGYRPWLLAAWALGFAALALGAGGDARYGPVVFVGLGLLALGLAQARPATAPKRTTLAVVSTSLLFAAVHSAVWPSPVPLFVLALGLGYLTARTGSIVPAVVVHGLFNGVSFVYLLRG